MTNLLLITLFTLLAGTVGGLVAHKLHIPAGALLGSMLAVGIYGSLGFQVYMPSQARVGAQIIIGCLLGTSLNRNTFMQLKSIVKPALIITISLLICSLVTGFILFKFFNLDMYTAFLSSSAGGMPELSLLALSLGGDGPKVALLHLIRLMVVIFTMPFVLNVFRKLFEKDKKECIKQK